MRPATTHVEKVVAVIITTLTLNIVQYVTVRLEQPLVVLATNNFLWAELHRLYTLDTGSYKGKFLSNHTCTICPSKLLDGALLAII